MHQRVLEKAAELGYQPNRHWKAVRSGRSNLIDIITVGTSQETARMAASQLPHKINTCCYDYMVIDLQ